MHLNNTIRYNTTPCKTVKKLIRNQQVIGSSPIFGSIKSITYRGNNIAASSRGICGVRPFPFVTCLLGFALWFLSSQWELVSAHVGCRRETFPPITNLFIANDVEDGFAELEPLKGVIEKIAVADIPIRCEFLFSFHDRLHLFVRKHWCAEKLHGGKGILLSK